MKRSRNLFRAAFDRARDAILLTDQEARLVEANGSACALTGYSRKALLGRRVWDLFSDPTRREAAALSRQLVDSGTVDGESLLRCRDGRLVDIEIRAVASVVPGVHLFVLRDISVRKRSDADLAWQLRDLARSRRMVEDQSRLLGSILDGIGEGVIVADRRGKFLLFNPAAKKLLGVGAVDGPVRHWSRAYGLFYPDSSRPYPAHRLPLARAIAGEQVDDAEVLIRNHAVPSGRRLRVNGRPLRDAAGNLAGGVVVFREAAERSLARHGRARSAIGAGALRPSAEAPLRRELSRREEEVLRLLADGHANKQAARLLGIGVRTVETHRESIMRKLDIHNIAGLTKYAIAQGLLELS